MLIEIVGPYPPPYGGISNHIYRLSHYLVEENVNYRIYNQYSYESTKEKVTTTKSSYLWWIGFLFRRNRNVVHFHFFSIFHFYYCCIFSHFNTSNIIITIHNEDLLKKGKLHFIILSFFLRHTKAKKIIVVSSKIYQILKDSGVKNILYLPAYVPPTLRNCGEAPDRKGHKKNIFMNIWRIDNHKTISIYGFDFFVQLAKTYNEQCNFFLFLGSEDNIDIVKQYMGKKKVENIKVITNENLVDHFFYCDIFLRLNREDAYGVSIQEALDSSVPAIASDVCQRPEGATLFKNGDFSDLRYKFEGYLQDYITIKKNLHQNMKSPEYHKQLISLYKETIGTG